MILEPIATSATDMIGRFMNYKETGFSWIQILHFCIFWCSCI